MTHKQKNNIIFQILWLVIFIIAIRHQPVITLCLFLMIFFTRNKFDQHNFIHSMLSKKGFFSLALLLVFQNFYSINLFQSLNQLPFMLFTYSKFTVVSVACLLLFLIYSIMQEGMEFSIPHPSEFAGDSIQRIKAKKTDYVNLYSDSRTKLNRENVKYLLKDIPRHGYLNYTNQQSLSKQYFKMSEYFIEQDNCLYLILSETGSPASEIISLFTHSEYNHLSLSFDRSLQTMISYNGGNYNQQPGLNTEDFTSLNQKIDSQLLVYSLKASKKEQRMILNKIKQINQEGSAYNVLGLLTKRSILPNMMYCSQFIYQMLALANLNVFEPTAEIIKPTDFIAYDWDEKLTFEYKIDFSLVNHDVIN